MLRIAVVGSRWGVPAGAVRAFVRSLPAGSCVVSGGARGVDTEAACAARAAGLSLREHLPDDPSNPLSYLARNERIVLDSDLVVAFHNGTSSGTLSAMEWARYHGVPLVVVRGPVWCLASALLSVRELEG